MKLQRPMSLTQGLLSLKGCTSLELTVPLAEASTADAFFCCRGNCSATLFLFIPASCTSLQVLFLSILQNKPPVFKHVCLEPNYKRRKRKYGRHTSVFFFKCPGLEAALITFIHIAIARTSVLTTCVCNITEKYTTSLEYSQKRREIVITATVSM